ncbi:unnamed protein product [Bursaphelenchus xylophilus]|uniref:(pine wood nematode) hypothetical protein n=1 Tax=Bursaphelenchus xylophilus TaxID=6326 RepID=A0A1I7RS64_BURXY|nr:unnamed protein product [Bursaphelenchus xylophilus]CAG9123175.1 unnamed protein product [Bursaphelenchus xylophilus]
MTQVEATGNPNSEPVTAQKPSGQTNLDGLLNREHFHTEFDTLAYLKDFYTNVDDPAMQMVLTFLPGMVARLPRINSVLDFGAGPTIHVAVCFRHKAEEIYLADYLVQNRDELERWLAHRSTFDWTKTLKMIATQEGMEWSKICEMEPATRPKIKGIFPCNCLDDNVLDAPRELLGSFGMVTTIFTLEYCCNTQEEYRNAIRRVVSLVKPGGYFFMGGILEETWCSFGGRRFTCLYITMDFMLSCLRDAGLNVDLGNPAETLYYEINGMFLIQCHKPEL